MFNRRDRRLDKCSTKSPQRKSFTAKTVDNLCTTSVSQSNRDTSPISEDKMYPKAWSETSLSPLYSYQKYTTLRSASKMMLYLAMTFRARSWTATAARRTSQMSMLSSYSHRTGTTWILQAKTEKWKTIMSCWRKIVKKEYSRMMLARYICYQTTIAHLA